ncbi:hypothetical protein ScPMuIL_015460 [Solemya velum]
MSDDGDHLVPTRPANTDREYTVVALPVRGLSEVNRLSVERLAKLLRHRVQFAMVLQPEKRMVIVINLTCGIKERGIAVLAGAFKKLEFLRKDRVAYLYILRPKNKQKSKLLKRMFGIKKGEQTAYLNQFKVVLLKTLSELHAYVDRSNLTEDYGGTVKYCHNSWFYFYKVISPVLHRAYDVLKSLTITRVKIQGLKEYDTTNLERMLDVNEHSFCRKCGIKDSIDECKQTITKLEHNQDDNHLSRISPTLLTNGLTALKRMCPSLSTASRDMEILWLQTEEQFELDLKLLQFKEDTERLSWILTYIGSCTLYQPYVNGIYPQKWANSTRKVCCGSTSDPLSLGCGTSDSTGSKQPLIRDIENKFTARCPCTRVSGRRLARPKYTERILLQYSLSRQGTTTNILHKLDKIDLLNVANQNDQHTCQQNTVLMNRATQILEDIKSSMQYCTIERGQKAKDIAMSLTDAIQPFAQKTANSTKST